VKRCVTHSVDLPSAAPGLIAMRCTTEELGAGIKDYHAVARVETGRSEWWGRGREWRSAPGSVSLKEPEDVYRYTANDGPVTFTLVMLPEADILRVREDGKALSLPHLEAGDERAAPFHRLHDAVCEGADRFTLEVALAETIATFGRLRDARREHTRPVRRAVEYLRANLAEPVTLDELAAHAALDKFHLARAFRAQVGLPPHAYLTHLRIRRAKELLAQGVRASELAPRVGICDQSQLTRHFRRIVGTTPARYANAI
jgi:AraC-like DNA-binding protein